MKYKKYVRYIGLPLAIALVVTGIAFMLINHYVPRDAGRAALYSLIRINHILILAAAGAAIALGIHDFVKLQRSKPPAAARRTIFIALVSILVVAGLLLGARHYDALYTQGISSEKLIRRAENMEIVVPETHARVTLANGSAPYVDGDTRGTVTLGSFLGEHTTLEGDRDMFFELIVDDGGSGTFHYLALVHMSPPRALLHTSSVFVGDRVSLQSASPASDEISNTYDLVVSYLDRAPADPFATAPAMSHQLVVTIKSHVIEQ